MLINVSPVRVSGGEGDQFIGRLAQAEDEGRVTDPELVNVMLKRGKARRTPRRNSLDEYDGNWN